MKRNRKYNPQRVSAKCLVSLLMLSGTIMAGAQETSADSLKQVQSKKTIASTVATKEVSGKVVDAATGTPLIGVRVEALGSGLYTTMTTENGNFTIKVPVYTSLLYVSTEEYNGVQVAIKANKDLQVSLYPTWFNNGYDKSTPLVATDKAIIKNSTSVSVDNELGNNLNASVRTITRGGMPAQGAAMFINGITSLNTISQPLVVVDGVMWDMQYDRKTLHDGFYNNVLAVIDPEDIESIEILQNGTARYGARGANGVILIKTKRSNSVVTRIRVNAFGGFETKPSQLSMMNGSQYRNYVTELFGTTQTGQLGSMGMTMNGFLNENPNYVYYPLYHNETDWSSDLYRKAAFTQSYKAVVEGGDDVAQYNLSLGYTTSQATTKNNDFERLNIRFNTNVNMFENLETEMDIAYSRILYGLRDNGWAESYAQRNISSPNVLGLVQSPFLSKYANFVVWDEATMSNKLVTSNSTYAGKVYAENPNPFRFVEDYGYAALVNPYWILQNGEGENKNHQEQSQFSLNFAPKYTFSRYLSVQNRFSYVLNRTNEKYYLPYNGTPDKVVEGLGNINSVIASQFSKSTAVFNDLQVHYNRRFDAHRLSAVAGVRYTNYSYTDNYVRGYNNTNDKMPNVSYSLQYLSYDGNNDRWTNLAYYIDADYSFRERYFAKLIATAESSSRFGKEADSGIKLFGVRWGIFPSLQLGWLMSSEPWFKSKAVNHLKFNAGVDVSGNDHIDYYAARTYFINGKFMNKSTMLTLANIKNEKIQWETTTRFTLGAESRMFDNRLSASVDLYYSKISNMLSLRDPGFATGFSSVWSNDGSMKNVGANANVNVILVNSKDWRWQVGATAGLYKNEITALPSPVSTSDLTNTINYYTLDANGQKSATPYKTVQGYTSSVYGNNNILTAVGSAAGVFYGYQTQGVFSTDAEAAAAGQYGYLRYPTGLTEQPYRNFRAGDVHFVDQNGDGWISEADMVEIGDPNPDVFGNIYTSIGWKALTLDINFKYSLGNDVFNYQRSQLESGATAYNQTTSVVNRWTAQGQVTDVPRTMATTNDEWVNNERFSDRWIEDGSFLKLKRVRLTYKVPVKTGFLQGLSVWGEANNVFTITKYLGTDPEVTAGNSVLYQGIDAGLLSQGRNFNLGLSINL